MSLLLGYYADMLFKKYVDAFVKVIDFLVKSVALHGKEKVIALQSADTLSTIVSDKDLIPRLEPHLPGLLMTICQLNHNITVKLYFNFVLDFVKFYHRSIVDVGCGENVIVLVQSLVQRIQKELRLCHETGTRNNLIINKCWNIIRYISELDTIMPKYAASIEEQLKPLFEFMVDPTKIEFEDDIVLTIKSIIKKTNQVSPVMWTLFPLLTKVFEKNKNTFGNLLDTLNQYLITGREQIGDNSDFLRILIRMANDSLFTTEPTIISHNCEGAILFQLLFQVYAGTVVLDEFFNDILTQVLRRMTSQPMQHSLKRQLLSVLLTSMAYNPARTLAFLEQRSLVDEFFSQLLQDKMTESFKNNYEQKVFIIGLTSAINAPQLPPSMMHHMLKIIQESVQML
jgi:hypothetical protein